MPRTRRHPKTLAALAALLAAACADPARDPFTATGEVIAMGGGDFGVQGACFTCHGLEGLGDGQAAPRLASLQAGYLQKQLQDYADGRRADPVMGPIAKALDDDDRRAVSAYYAGLPFLAGPAAVADRRSRRLYHRGDADRGLAPCAACHGEAGEGLGLANPPLAGQPPAYIAEQLRRWRAGKRQNDPRGVMATISARLTPGEIEALSRYAAAPGPPDAPDAAVPEASR